MIQILFRLVHSNITGRTLLTNISDRYCAGRVINAARLRCLTLTQIRGGYVISTLYATNHLESDVCDLGCLFFTEEAQEVSARTCNSPSSNKMHRRQLLCKRLALFIIRRSSGDFYDVFVRNAAPQSREVEKRPTVKNAQNSNSLSDLPACMLNDPK
jgi:hypothetical protein